MIWWIERIDWIVVYWVMDIHWSYQNLLFWTGIVWLGLSTNQIVRCFKLEKRKSYMRYQVDFLPPLKLQKISYYFGLCRTILLANQFCRIFYFWLVWLINLNTGGPLLHCTCSYYFLVIVSFAWFFSSENLFWVFNFLYIIQ